MFDFTLIIPAFNEAKRITQTTTTLAAFFESQKYWSNKKVVLILVNDGSHDETGELIQKLAKKYSPYLEVQAITYSQNKGKGGAIQTGVKSISAQSYGFIDADLAFDPENLTTMHQSLQKAACVIGERNKETMKRGYSLFRKVASNFFHTLVQTLTGLPFRDTQCGIKVFNESAAKLVKNLTHTRFAFDIELLTKLQEENQIITSHSVTFRKSTESSITLRDGLRYLLDAISISDRFKRPISWRFYALLSAAATTITLLFFGWVLKAGYFFSDDFTWLWYGKSIGFDLYKTTTYMMSSFYSPVLNAFYAWSLSLAGLYAPYYFLAGILAHITVSVLSGALVQRLFSSRIMAFLTTVLVASAGGAREPILWIGANMHSFVTLFILACLIHFDAFVITRKIHNFSLSFLFFLLALGTKETAAVLPALMLMVLFFRWKNHKNFIFKPSVLLSSLIFLAPYCFYLFKQYQWQTSGIWVNNGSWNFDLIRAILRSPYVILDLFIPVKPLIEYTHSWFVGLLSFFSITWLGWKYRTLPPIRAGFYWIIITITPTIFFVTERISDPLPSRYEYLPRIGMAIILAGLFAHYIKNNSSRSVINFFAFFLFLVSLTHIGVMIKTTNAEYSYVYNTGRTLVQAIKTINPQTKKIFVNDSRPFPDNQAHIIGALNVILNIKENQIIFIDRNTPILDSQKNLPPNSVLLYWDHDHKTYKIFSK